MWAAGLKMRGATEEMWRRSHCQVSASARVGEARPERRAGAWEGQGSRR